jgi:cytochrome c biogenesis protein CcmG, thiol:disulfide interchange protein DsbE
VTEEPTVDPITPSGPPARRAPPWPLLLFVAGALIFGLGAAMLIINTGTQPPPAIGSISGQGVTRARVGNAIPAFALKRLANAGDQAGQTVTLESLRGKRVLINFWASWCPPCVEETPALIDAYRELNDPNIVFVGIGTNDSNAKLAAFASEYKIPYLVLSDEDGSAADAFGVFAMPTTFFVDSGGIVRAIHNGAIDKARVIAETRRLR